VAARRASRIMRQVNLVLVFVWIIPTVLFWKNSILWIALMSIYAVVVSHWGAYQASRAETEAENNNGG
jgi:hypothetical protein